ncbi:radical SAM protein [Candidatus Woesearchaeota archaeon]|nr:radical SAM protein [Candidatus Woesearchaeota archaeon]
MITNFLKLKTRRKIRQICLETDRVTHSEKNKEPISSIVLHYPGSTTQGHVTRQVRKHKIAINFTSRCLFRCRHCYIWQQQNNYYPLEKETWTKFLDEVKEIYGTNVIIEIGGSGMAEINKNLMPVLKHASSLGFETTYSTNCHLVNNRILLRLLESGLTSLVIGLDFFTDKGHDVQRGVRNSHKHVLKVFDMLKTQRHSTNIIISCIIMKSNLDEIIPLTKWINQQEHITCISFNSLAQPLWTETDPNWHRKYTNLWPEETGKVMELLDELILMKRQGCKIANTSSQLESFKRYFNDPNRFIRGSPCNADELGFQVTAEGELKNCMNKRSLGNLKEISFKELLDSENYSTLSEEISGCTLNCHQIQNCRYTDD